MSNDDDEVGYRKPPAANRFKPGQSGNRKGRPKGSRNYATELREEGNETLAVSENGRTRKISKKRALLKRVMTKGLNGDMRAAIYMLEKLLALDAAQEGRTEESLNEDDKAILATFLKRHKPDPEGGDNGSQPIA